MHAQTNKLRADLLWRCEAALRCRRTKVRPAPACIAGAASIRASVRVKIPPAQLSHIYIFTCLAGEIVFKHHVG